MEIEKMKQTIEKAEEARELATKNYNTLAAQVSSETTC